MESTLNAATLLSHTPGQAQRERELSLCATMLLPVLVTWARKSRRKPFRIANAMVDNYERKRPKVKRRWPKRKDHNMAGQPKFRKLTNSIKAMELRRLEEK